MKDELALRYATSCTTAAGGRPSAKALDALVTATQKNVTGTVK